MVYLIQTKEEFNEILSEDAPFIVEFWSPWSYACKSITPDYQDIADTCINVLFFKLDVEQLPSIPMALGVSAQVTEMPVFLAFKNGQKIGEVEGPWPSLVRALAFRVGAA